jgi:hypothetical protein
MQVQHTHYVYVRRAAGADIHNVLPAGTDAIVVLVAFVEQLAVLILQFAEHGAETKIPAVLMTHITLPLNQHILVAVCVFHKITVVAVLAILWFALHLSQEAAVALLTLLKALVSVVHGVQAD